MAYGIAGYVLDDLQTQLEDTRGELEDAVKRAEKYEALLSTLYTWFDDRSDAHQFGEDEFVPNEEMVIATQIEEALQ